MPTAPSSECFSADQHLHWLVSCLLVMELCPPGRLLPRQGTTCLAGQVVCFCFRAWLLFWCKPAVLVSSIPIAHVHCLCPACRWMASEYRRPLLLEELLGYNADILCLQEVDEKAFRVFFGPQFWHAGGSCAGAACQHCCTGQLQAMPHSTPAACQHCCAEPSRVHLAWPPLDQDKVWPQTRWCLAALSMSCFCFAT